MNNPVILAITCVGDDDTGYMARSPQYPDYTGVGSTPYSAHADLLESIARQYRDAEIS